MGPATTSPAIISLPASGNGALAGRVRRLLLGCDLSIHRLSEITRRPPFGEHTPYFIPHMFLSDLRRGERPHLCQIAALSEITGYRFEDWLAEFGFPAGRIPALQAELLRSRTMLVPVGEGEKSWWPAIASTSRPMKTEGLARFLEQSRWTSLLEAGGGVEGRYLYVRIGSEDGYLYPRLAPGSIVRVDRQRRSLSEQGPPRPVWVVEHARGLTCGHVEPLDRARILVTPHHLAYAPMEFRLGHEAALLGVVDSEIRCLPETPGRLAGPSAQRRRGPFRAQERETQEREKGLGLGALLRKSRLRLGLQFREAQALTLRIAEEMRDKRYFIGVASLSDYEAAGAVPRHVAKSISLCIICGLDFRRYLRAAGIRVEALGTQAIPCEGAAPESPRAVRHTSFLDASLGAMLGAERISPADVFVAGAEDPLLHPLLEGAAAVVVNRAQRRIVDGDARWERPMFLVRKPEGGYLIGFCALQGNALVVQPHPEVGGSARILDRRDTDVIGRVAAVLRKTPAAPVQPHMAVDAPPRMAVQFTSRI
ncbi:MAG: hypothetical protein ACRD8O_19865 [Bryobacteraceae bacterium]